MNSFNSALATAFILISILSCKKEEADLDASGAFEAEETIISSEATGSLKQFDLEEGQILKAGQVVGYVDSVQLFLRKKQLELQARALLGKRPDVPVQLAALQEQLKTAEKEKVRFTNLVKADAATPKQLDDVAAQVDLIKAQITAQKSALEISSGGLSKDAAPFYAQIDQLNDQLEKCKIVNPIDGTVLTKYTEQNEMTAPGKPLYKIADLSTIILRAYVSVNQLAGVKLGQKVKVSTDDGEGGMRETEGTVSWINDKAEFTPKTIQTKEERANMVYAIMVKVKNDGTYKIGMYGEIKFH